MLCLVSTTDCYTVTLYLTAALASTLECAHPKNVPVNPLESAITKSLDLKSPEMNSYKKVGVPPPFLLQSSFVNRCSSVFICGYTFCLTKIQFRAGFGYNLRRTYTGAEA